MYLTELCNTYLLYINKFHPTYTSYERLYTSQGVRGMLCFHTTQCTANCNFNITWVFLSIKGITRGILKYNFNPNLDGLQRLVIDNVIPITAQYIK